MIVFWPVLGVLVVIAGALCIALRPGIMESWFGSIRARRPYSRTIARLIAVRDRTVESVGRWLAFALLLSASLPVIVLVCFAVGMIVTHQPVWGANASLYRWFHQAGTGAPVLLGFLRGVSRLGEWRSVLIVSGAAGIGLIFAADRRRWVGPVLVGIALIVERDVQSTIGWFVHQPKPPTTLASFPSGGVARVVAVYAFILYLYLRLRVRTSWNVLVLAWTSVSLLALLMGYARAALLLHWPFDIPGGYLLGALLLSSMVAACSVFNGWFFPVRSPAPGTSAPSEQVVPANDRDGQKWRMTPDRRTTGVASREDERK
jgi:membrane-associated phospholipid phosphatase